MPDEFDFGYLESMMIDGRRTFNLRNDGGVDATMTVLVCGQASVIEVSVDPAVREMVDGALTFFFYKPSPFELINQANAILDEKLAALKLELGEAA